MALQGFAGGGGRTAAGSEKLRGGRSKASVGLRCWRLKAKSQERVEQLRRYSNDHNG
jgi:hypothetical protein